MFAIGIFTKGYISLNSIGEKVPSLFVLYPCLNNDCEFGFVNNSHTIGPLIFLKSLIIFFILPLLLSLKYLRLYAFESCLKFGNVMSGDCVPIYFLFKNSFCVCLMLNSLCC